MSKRKRADGKSEGTGAERAAAALQAGILLREKNAQKAALKAAQKDNARHKGPAASAAAARGGGGGAAVARLQPADVTHLDADRVVVSLDPCDWCDDGDIGYRGDFACTRLLYATIAVDGVEAGHFQATLVHREQGSDFHGACEPESAELYDVGCYLFEASGTPRDERVGRAAGQITHFAAPAFLVQHCMQERLKERAVQRNDRTPLPVGPADPGAGAVGRLYVHQRVQDCGGAGGDGHPGRCRADAYPCIRAARRHQLLLPIFHPQLLLSPPLTTAALTTELRIFQSRTSCTCRPSSTAGQPVGPIQPRPCSNGQRAPTWSLTDCLCAAVYIADGRGYVNGEYHFSKEAQDTDACPFLSVGFTELPGKSGWCVHLPLCRNRAPLLLCRRST